MVQVLYSTANIEFRTPFLGMNLHTYTDSFKAKGNQCQEIPIRTDIHNTKKKEKEKENNSLSFASMDVVWETGGRWLWGGCCQSLNERPF